jgi:hypothetical protein
MRSFEKFQFKMKEELHIQTFVIDGQTGRNPNVSIKKSQL